MTDTNEKNTRIDEDEPKIDEDQARTKEKNMREFGRRKQIRMNEWCRWIPNPYFTF